MALGIPIAYALLVSGMALMWHLNVFDAQILAQNLIEGANSFTLLAVPFFLLAGQIMNVGGLSEPIVHVAPPGGGHRKGGARLRGDHPGLPARARVGPAGHA